MPRLAHLMDLTGRVYSPYVNAGKGPFGTRYIYNGAGGRFAGPGLKGRVLPGGGDWQLVDANGTMRLDIRVTLETDDGAVIFMNSTGVARSHRSPNAPQGHSADADSMYIMSTPRFETGDERYQWLNDFVHVAEGELEMLKDEGLLAQVTWHIYTVVTG
jgi:hypothetical protein